MMGSKFADYYKEKQDLVTIENDKGFVMFKITDSSIFVTDCYVVPHLRKSGAAKAFLDEIKVIAKIEGKKFIGCSVNTLLNGKEEAVLCMLSLGFKIVGLNNELIVFNLEV